jgi:threonine/homoserine/homoserine lactone efflux protein
MPYASSFSFFLVATLALLLTPGPAVLYVVARSMDQGRRAGIVSTLGLALGNLFHVAAAALGLSALLVSSALAFDAVKYFGAGYLIYLGIRRLREKELPPSELVTESGSSRLFYQGVVVNLLNPKTALFFLAFLPQFVDPSRGAMARQLLFLGFLFVVMAACTDTLWALLGGSVGNLMKRSSRLRNAERYFSGSVFIGLGLMTALTRAHAKRG